MSRPRSIRRVREVGFFCISGHGVDPALGAELEAQARAFFGQPEREKAAIGMARGGPAWRGWFPVGGELTSGHPDRKEGLYFGEELTRDDPRVVAGRPLHGPNLFPATPAGLRDVVLEWMAAMTDLGRVVMEGLGLAPRARSSVVRRASHRRSDHPVPDLPLPARRRRRLGRG